MSNSTQNHLQSEQNDSNQVPVAASPAGIIQPPTKVRVLIESTARFVVVYYGGSDFDFKRMVLSRSIGGGMYRFLWKSHRHHRFYKEKLIEYRVALPPENQRQEDDQKRKVISKLLKEIETSPSVVMVPEGITRKEVGIMELTAQFSARYGFVFGMDLLKTGRDDLAFTKPTDSRHGFYTSLVQKYGKVSTQAPYEQSIMNGFLDLIKHENQQKEKEGEEGVLMDWTVFESKHFSNKEITNPLVSQLNSINFHIPQHYEQMVVSFFETVQEKVYPEEPKLNRKKLDELGLVPEDEFLALHPGQFTIMVSVPSQSDYGFNWKDIEFTVQSLSESVRSLKEKIAEEIKIPANKLRLFSGDGEAGFLNGNKSLAYYNVGPGPGGILTLSIR